MATTPTQHARPLSPAGCLEVLRVCSTWASFNEVQAHFGRTFTWTKQRLSWLVEAGYLVSFKVGIGKLEAGRPATYYKVPGRHSMEVDAYLHVLQHVCPGHARTDMATRIRKSWPTYRGNVEAALVAAEAAELGKKSA